MSDRYDGIFDDLTPDMFTLETTAVDSLSGRFVGKDLFDRSTDERLRGVVAAYAATHGQLNPIAVLTNPELQRVFVPQPDENLGDFIERLKREAMLMGARWMFLGKRHQGFMTYDIEVDSDPDDIDSAAPTTIAAARSAGAAQQNGILWVAERREGAEVHHRHGVLAIDAAGRVVSSTEAPEHQSLSVFSVILDAVRQ